MNRPDARVHQSGFTLVELVVVAVILSLLSVMSAKPLVNAQHVKEIVLIGRIESSLKAAALEAIQSGCSVVATIDNYRTRSFFSSKRPSYTQIDFNYAESDCQSYEGWFHTDHTLKDLDILFKDKYLAWLDHSQDIKRSPHKAKSMIYFYPDGTACRPDLERQGALWINHDGFSDVMLGFENIITIDCRSGYIKQVKHAPNQ